ncbi:MAG: serpin family protein [bacterium]|nr:serpin family protein [bacterium]
MKNEEKNLEHSTEPLNKEVSVEVQQQEYLVQPELQVDPEQQDVELTQSKLEGHNKKTNNKKAILWIFITILLLGLIVFAVYGTFDDSKNENTEINKETKQNPYMISGNNLENFDLYFLQLENKEENKIYSPLSIKYALAMLNEGTDGTTNEEIKSLIGNYNANKYTNSNNMSLANALFIRNSFKESIKNDYSDKLINKYNAEVIFDEFNTPESINNWVSKNTFNLINNLLDDVSNDNFVLINALAIDMEWENKFISKLGTDASYSHEKAEGYKYSYSWHSDEDVIKSNFENVNDEISGMSIKASLNNYDIISKLGEDNIRKTVGDAYREYLKTDETALFNYLHNDNSDENIERTVNTYLDNYIKELSSNYGKMYKTTDFSFYTDDNVKVFAKDLKEYDGTTLQYVGIMPLKENLSTYIKNIDAEKIKNLINNLKTLEMSNAEKDAITEIMGYIPKFKFEYNLDLMNDLKKLGINEIFDSNRANLSKISSLTGNYISSVNHKANIEFTQDGIKASAATAFGGRGSGGLFDYFFDVPIIKIDLTFDKPYMFLIRDKKTGEVWFTGTVYNPLLWKDDTTRDCMQYNGC